MKHQAPDGDPIERLLDEQRQIEELFDSCARHRREPGTSEAEIARLARLIFTLLRVHLELETSLLYPALPEPVADDAAVARARSQSSAVAAAIERAEAVTPPQDREFDRRMEQLASLVRAKFEDDRRQIFPLVRAAVPDLPALDRQMGARQETLLSAGRAE